MPLPVPTISDEVQKQAYDDLAKGALREFGDAITIIARRVLSGQFKSKEELALDWQNGEEAHLNRRLLAAEALDRVPPPRRIFPAPKLLGVIFRGSEFDLPGTMTWEHWSQLLSRACDRERVGQAHPAFPAIISSLADDEFELVKRLQTGTIEIAYGKNSDGFEFIDPVSSEFLQAQFPYLQKGAQIMAAATHLEALGLVHDLIATAKGTYTEAPYLGLNRYVWTLELSEFGKLFVMATAHRLGEGS